METEVKPPPNDKGPEDAPSFKIVASHSTRLLHTLVTDPGEFYKLFSKEVLTWKFGITLLAMGLVAVGAYCLRGHFATKEIQGIQTEDIASNRALVATNTALAQKVADAEKSRDEMRQERDKLQLMLAPFEAFAMAKYTNAPIEGRLDMLSATMISLTNSLVLDRPTLNLEINGQIVTNNEVFILKDPRNLRIRVRNVSEATAEGVSVDFIAPIELSRTNVEADGWALEPMGYIKASDGKELPVTEHWEFKVAESMGGHSFWDVPTIKISTNFNYHGVQCTFGLYANRTKNDKYAVVLMLQ